MANLEAGIPLSKVSPKFLHANSTSHTWPFSAIAELIDNAYDPDVNASELWIDKVEVGETTCLTFTDNGNGLDEDKLLKMLSFGFCEKDVYEKSNHKPIGHYGNGFKSGSMRLGDDALVFTRSCQSTGVGMLSQTFLNTTKLETVMVPIVTWDIETYEKRQTNDSANNLSAITKFSPFKSEATLFKELVSLERLRTGTKIYIYNLKRSKIGSFELDFESDNNDVRNPETLAMDMTTVYRPMGDNSPELRQSLREYCSILFLKPRMKIVIRGQKVKTKLISKSLSHTEIDLYKPGWLGRPLKIVFGFTCSKDAGNENYGIMMYHKNRLIKAYEKVGYQKQRNNLGDGVVGVVQVDFLQPIHNKQDFNKDEKYNSFMTNISTKLNDYWNEKKCGGSRVQVAPSGNLPDWLWAQCENCLKWRRLPDGVATGSLPDRWFCHMNPDGSHNRCDIEEEPEDEDDALNRPTYQKTYKKQMEEKKRMSKIEEHRRSIQKEKELRVREQAVQNTWRQIQSETVHSSKNQAASRKDVISLEKALIESKKREATQKKLILQLQSQKKVSEQQKGQLMKAAENLRVVNMQNNNLLETAESIAGVNPVSSTSGNGNKNSGMCIKMEDGEVIAVVENRDSADADKTDKTTGKKRKPESSDLIDLTMDSDDEDLQLLTPNKVSRCDDVKPDKDLLDKEIENEKEKNIEDTAVANNSSVVNDRNANEENNNVTEDMETETNVNNSSAGQNSKAGADAKGTDRHKSADKNKDVKPNLTELDKQIDESKKQRKGNSSASRSAKEKQIGPRKEKDVGLSENEVSQRYEELKKMYSSKCTDLTRCQEELSNLQENVHKLLQIIVPDVELGSSKDITYVVEEMIRVNSDESLVNSSSPST